MNKDITIQSELLEIAPTLAQISRKMPFSVPDGYFEKLSESLVEAALINEEIIPSKGSVPTGYFDTLPQMLLQKIRQQEVATELESIAPALNEISKAMPYALPKGYFENFTVDGIQSTGAKVVAMRPSYLKRLMQVAAAVAILLAGFTIWKMSQSTVIPTQSGSEVASVDNPADTDTTSSEIDLQLSAMDEAALTGYLSETGIPSETRSALYYLNTENFENALQEFSADEISEQLQQVPMTKKTI